MATNRRHAKATRIGHDLVITKTSRRASGAGTWVAGRVAGYRFSALVFPEHAENPDYELAYSRISKLWLQRLSDEKTAVNFDRGWDVRATDATAKAVVEFLAQTLADLVYRT